MERRVELIREWNGGESIASLAGIYGVARKTIYKWIARHAAEGVAGLQDRSRAPHSSPQQTTAETIAQVIAAATLGLGTTQAVGQTRGSLAGDETAGGQHHRRAVAE